MRDFAVGKLYRNLILQFFCFCLSESGGVVKKSFNVKRFNYQAQDFLFDPSFVEGTTFYAAFNATLSQDRYIKPLVYSFSLSIFYPRTVNDKSRFMIQCR